MPGCGFRRWSAKSTSVKSLRDLHAKQLKTLDQSVVARLNGSCASFVKTHPALKRPG